MTEGTCTPAALAANGSDGVLRVVFLGPAGCGKGTQCLLMKEKYGLEHFSTGDMLRDHVARGTDIGKVAKDIMARGELVPDAIMIGIIEDALKQLEGKKGFILDGFPRTLTQAEGLKEMLEKNNAPINCVFSLEVADSLLIDRVCGRRIHPASGRVYHVTFNPPKTEGLDDVTGEPLIQRADDNEEALKTRLASFHKANVPVKEYYEQKGLCHTVDASKPIGEVTALLETTLDTIVTPLASATTTTSA